MEEQLVRLALSKVKSERERIEPGTHRGRVAVVVDFDLRVGPDYTQRVSAAIPWRTLFAVALSKLNGATVESIVREALSELPNYTRTNEADIEERARVAVDSLLDKSVRECAGKVTGDVSLVSVEEIAR